MHSRAVLKQRKTPQNNGISAQVAFRLRSPRGASRSAVSTHCRGRLNVSSWSHRRTSIVLLPHFWQQRWEMAQHCRTPTTFLPPSKRHGIVVALHLSRAFSVQPVLPNPSLKLTPDGMARRPVRAGASPHFARPGGTRYIFTSPGLASYRRRPLSSNVRRRNSHRCLTITIANT